MTSTAASIWDRLAKHPWLTMTFAVFAQTWFCLSNRALWFSDEVRYANAYQNIVHGGKWMVLSLNGQPYPDKPPVYFWFLWLLDTITPMDMPGVFFLGAALSGLFFLYGAYFLARSLNFDRSISLASTLILLSTFFLVALFHYSRMDLMFAALILLSHACLFRAFNEKTQGKWPLYAFLLAGVATLIKGPLAFIFPLLTSSIYLAWRGELKKLFTRQMGLGLLAMIGVLLAWVAGVMLAEGPDFLLNTVLGKHVIQRATKTFHHRESFYYYLIAFPLAWLPWTLFLFVAPIKKYLSIKTWGELWAVRKQAGPRAFLWIMFAATFIFLSSLSGKVLIYILPMFAPLAILTGAAIHSMDEARTNRLWALVGGLWAIFGVGLILAGDLLPFPVPIRGMGIAATLLLVGGAAIFLMRKYGNKAALLTTTLAMIIWLYPIGLMVAPSLDNGMSTKRQAEIMSEYMDRGYAPYALKIYSGIFTYYAEHNFRETNHLPEFIEWTQDEDKVVLAIRERHWNNWKDQLPAFHIVDRQSIAGMIYLIAIKG